jgi:hypothetical protein
MKKHQLKILGGAFVLALGIIFGIITLQSPKKTFSVQPVMPSNSKFSESSLTSIEITPNNSLPPISKSDQARIENNVLIALNCVRVKKGLSVFEEFDEDLSGVARRIINNEHIDSNNYSLVAIQALQFENNKTDGCTAGGFNMFQLETLGNVTKVGLALAPPDPFGGIGSVIVGR